MGFCAEKLMNRSGDEMWLGYDLTVNELISIQLSRLCPSHWLLFTCL